MHKRAVVSWLFLAALALAGCTTADHPAPPPVAGLYCPTSVADLPMPEGLAGETYCAVDRLLARLPGRLPPEAVVLVASLADIDDLEESSSFGRLLAEQVGSRLVQRGYRVREVKLSNSIIMREQGGEFVLSRDLKRIRDSLDADVVVTGTYGQGLSNMYVNLRMTRLADGVVLAAYDFEVTRGADVIALTLGEQEQTYLPGYPRR